MAVAKIYPEPEKSAARNSLLAIASAATCRTSSSEKRPRGFSIAPTRSRKTERRSTGTAVRSDHDDLQLRVGQRNHAPDDSED
jgi:hypothetical protein